MKYSWRELLYFLGKLKVGAIFTRREIKDIQYNLNTIDSYRLLLMNAGFIKRIEPGVFRIIKPIKYISLRKIKNAAQRRSNRRVKI